MKNRRSEPRFMCADLVTIVAGPANGPTEKTVANLEDISPSGACLHLEAAIAEGTDVEIVCSRCRLRGKVRHCRFVGIGWDAGVEFDAPGCWDLRQFQPEHLVDFPACDSRTPPRR